MRRGRPPGLTSAPCFTGAVVTYRVAGDELFSDGDLDRFANDGDLDLAAAKLGPDPVAGASEADVAAEVDVAAPAVIGGPVDPHGPTCSRDPNLLGERDHSLSEAEQGIILSQGDAPFCSTCPVTGGCAALLFWARIYPGVSTSRG